jgi:hypothetical protein
MLIMPQPNDEKTQLRVRISNTVLNEVEQYCEWADIKYRDYFIEQACKYIFNSDNDWKEYKMKSSQENTG